MIMYDSKIQIKFLFLMKLNITNPDFVGLSVQIQSAVLIFTLEAFLRHCTIVIHCKQKTVCEEFTRI